MTKAIMFQGTASNVGKSVLAAGFCRILLEDGYTVAPFKAQNMALNSFVTEDGLEMGRAQAVQAAACRIKPDVHMNPVLLKPSKDTGSQVIVMGKPAGNMTVKSYAGFKQQLRQVIHDAYRHLASQYDVIVIEGAGSPAEINLKKDEITNMHVAKMTGCPVIIVGDIDRGGVYAHLIGTYDLLDPDEQDLTAGFIINKFRGNADLLKPANDFLENRTGKTLFGVVPMVRELNLPDEDSVEFKTHVNRHIDPSIFHDLDKINIGVIDLPHISNFTDMDVFALDPDVKLTVIGNPEGLEGFDLIILPGSKNTINDMNYLRQKGFVPALERCVSAGRMIAGICGGYQMLGKKIIDPDAVESLSKETNGLGFLDMTTVMSGEKRLTQVDAVCTEGNLPVRGYEIHHGHTQSNEPPFLLNQRADASDSHAVYGGRNQSGSIWGTYIHGIFDGAPFRNFIINKLRLKKGLTLTSSRQEPDLDKELSRLAAVLRQSIDINAIYKKMF